MLKSKVQKWLSSGKDYDIGVSIYNEFGQSSFQKKMFAQGKTSFNEKKLLEELTKLMSLDNDDKSRAPTTFPLPKVIETKYVKPKTEDEKKLDRYNEEDDNFFNLPESLQQAVMNRKKWYKKAGFIHSQIHEASYQERSKLIPEMMDLYTQIQEVWKQLDYFKIHGVVMPEPDDVSDLNLEQLSTLERIAMLKRIAPWISRNKHLETLDPKTPKEIQQKKLFDLKLRQKTALLHWQKHGTFS